MNIILFGPPGSGKGTQSSLLIKNMNMKQISTGDLLRTAIKNKTELGEKASGFMARGDLVPDEVVAGMVSDFIKANGLKEDYIFDGYPRNTDQASYLDELLKGLGLKIDHVVFLNVAREMLVKRLSGRRVCAGCGATYHVTDKPSKVAGVCDVCGGNTVQRDDDKEAAIANRLEVYEKNTAVLKDFYSRQNKLKVVDGSLHFDEIHQSLKNIILK